MWLLGLHSLAPWAPAQPLCLARPTETRACWACLSPMHPRWPRDRARERQPCLPLSSFAGSFQGFCLCILHTKLPSPRRGGVTNHGGKKATQSMNGRKGSCPCIQHVSLSKGCSVAAGWGMERNLESSLDHQRLLLFLHRSPLIKKRKWGTEKEMVWDPTSP